MQKMVSFIKKETVLCAAFLLAVISCIIVPPSAAYLSYIDYRILGILFGLMLIMAGLTNIGIFDKICAFLLKKTTTLRQLRFVLVYLCFFTSMFITNDAALVTFVPLAIAVLIRAECTDSIVPVVILQTLAANLGSMLMPSGNPQNLYLFQLSGMNLGEFILLMLPYSLLSLLLLTGIILFSGNQPIAAPADSHEADTKHTILPAIVQTLFFAAGILTVCRLIPWELFFGVTALFFLLTDRKAFVGVDYSLLLTFCCFFVFIGNIGSIPEVHAFLGSLVSGHEVPIAIGASQIISNVPAALMLSGFTTRYSQLIIGTDLGGLGTLIASMASLISYKAVAAKFPEKRKKYLLRFTMWNIIFLILLLAEYYLLKKIL